MRYFFTLLLFWPLMPAFANVTDYVHSIQSDPNALYTFFKTMPKGGELHYHLSGGAYPETMLKLAENHSYCLNTRTFTVTPTTPCEGTPMSTLVTHPELYQPIIRAWSMKQFVPKAESAHDHFFASFYKFNSIVTDFQPQLLAEIMARAANQHELYLEIMILPDNAHSAAFANQLQGAADFSSKKRQLLNNPAFQNTIKETVTQSKQLLQQARNVLGCSMHPQRPACAIKVKFQYYVLREQPFDQVLAQALHGFAAVAQSTDLVGINLVQAEDGVISLRDYRKHMHLFSQLHKVYPQVSIALHAGELAPEDVPPEDLRTHIHDAILIGHAKRIGHGVDVAYEDHAEALLHDMAKMHIPVEINLTSNQQILGITGAHHPLRDYLAHHVPVVLSTDDEGILRTDLTREYVKAVMEHHLDYPTLKDINRNALTYSFLPGPSLWADPIQHVPVTACHKLLSPTCQNYLQHSEKARLEWQLEKNLTAFEQLYSTEKIS